MKRLLPLMCVVMLFNNPLLALGSGEISIATPQTTILLIPRGMAHVSLKIMVQNHRDNRKLRLDWEMGASEQQMNNPTEQEMDGSKEYDLPREESEYLLFTDQDFIRTVSRSMPDGLFLPVGEYEIRVTLTRKV